MIRQRIDREAIARCRSRLRSPSPTRDDLREAAECFLNAGSVQEAWDPLKKLVEWEPHDTSVRLLAGVVAAELGNINEAEAAFQEVIRQDPTAIAAYHNLGLIHLAANRPAQAEEQFHAILRVEPENGEALNDLAVLYASSGREEEACQFFDRCVSAAPGFKKGRRNALEFAHETGRYARGAEWTSRLIARDPSDTDLKNWQRTFAQALQEEGLLPAAERGTRQSATSAEVCRPTAPGHGTVTVCIPAYNAEQDIASTIDSVLNQTYPDLEIVVVDDGSTDETEGVVQQFAGRVSYVRRVRQGWAAAVNDGILRSRGRWILALSPGVVLKPEAIAECLSKCAEDAFIEVVEIGDSPEQEIPSSTWLLNRRAFARTGFFDETADDEDGFWSRRLMAAKISRICRVNRMSPSSFSQTWSAEHDVHQATEHDAYRAGVMRRWSEVVQGEKVPSPKPSDAVVKTAATAGLSVVIVGTHDPGGMFSSLATAINEHTRHRCRVVAQDPSRIDGPSDHSSFAQQVRALARDADRLVFVMGIAPGAARRDRRLDDSDELVWDAVDWREYAEKKSCAAFLCSSPSVRGNYVWYRERIAGRGWPAVTAWPDIYLNVPESHFAPFVIDLSRPEYTRADFSVGPVAIVHHDRPAHAGGGEELLGPVAAQLKAKYGDRVLFGRCSEMTSQETLIFRQHAHIGFDRISLGAPRFGLTSLENSALGLVNLVYLDAFARALLARALGTEELPWLSPDSPAALFEILDRLLADPNDLRRRMVETAGWFRRWWSPDRVVTCFTNVLESI